MHFSVEFPFSCQRGLLPQCSVATRPLPSGVRGPRECRCLCPPSFELGSRPASRCGPAARGFRARGLAALPARSAERATIAVRWVWGVAVSGLRGDLACAQGFSPLPSLLAATPALCLLLRTVLFKKDGWSETQERWLCRSWENLPEFFCEEK